MNDLIEKAKELNLKLSVLLKNPEPETISWCMSLHETLISLGKLSGTNKHFYNDKETKNVR